MAPIQISPVEDRGASNGFANDTLNGQNGSSSNGVHGDHNAYSNGTNGHSNGTNGHANGINGGNGVNGHNEAHGDTFVKGANGTNRPHISTNGLDSQEGRQLGKIAIVGMACRLPGEVTSADKLWSLCSRGRSAWSKIPEDRFNHKAYHHPNADRSGAYNPEGGHFLTEDPALFDAPFFNISAEEAKAMDPQHRILLETTFEALESGGFPKQDLNGQNVGVFVGGSFADYELNNYKDIQNVPQYQATGCAASLLSNRLSYYFNFKGPSMTVDTACSSSLYALHLAVQSLRSGESSHAVVGGCHLTLTPDYFISMSLSRLFSDTGKSHPFDSQALSGYGRGEGSGCVILRPLEDALAAGDNIRAVITNTGLNQDGRTQGITMPNGEAQEKLMRSVYSTANIDPHDVGYVEAHGTGTKVGDPIEAGAIHRVFAKGRQQGDRLLVGSIKSNIGHLEGASGIISLIKTAMILERGFVLPNHGFQSPNPAIPLEAWNMKVLKKLTPWPRHKKYASINNFGFGGGNAHVVLESAPLSSKVMNVRRDALLRTGKLFGEETTIRPKLFALSASDKDALLTRMKNTELNLEQRPDAFEAAALDDVVYTLGQRRSHLPWKVAFPASIGFEAINTLSDPSIKPEKVLDDPIVGFVYTGQGAQWHAMGRELIGNYPVFTATLLATDKYLREIGADFSVVEELQKDQKSSLVGLAKYSQPLCTAIQIALTDLLHEWGITPAAVTGHSSGEIGAAYAAGILSMEDCMSIAYYRGVVADTIKTEHPEVRGSMMAIGCNRDDIKPHLEDLDGTAVVACINSPTSITVSGDENAIIQLQEKLERLGIFNRKLQVTVAYHSHHMRLVAQEYLARIGKIRPCLRTKVTFHSSVYGRQVEPLELAASYWISNLVSPVEFNNSLDDLIQYEPNGPDSKVNVLIEVGPHSALAGPVRDILNKAQRASKVTYGTALVRNKNAIESMQTLAGTLFCKGVEVNFDTINFPVHFNKRLPKVVANLSPYPWNHTTRHWHETRLSYNHNFPEFGRSDVLGLPSVEGDDLEPRWRNVIRADDLPWVRGHKIQGANVWPLAGYVAMAIEAAGQQAHMQNVEYDNFILRDVSVGKFLAIPDAGPVETMVTLRSYGKDVQASAEAWSEFKVISYSEGRGWEENARGLITVTKSKDPNPVNGEQQLVQNNRAQQDLIASVKSNSTCKVDAKAMYEYLDANGVQYTGGFRSINNIQAGNSKAILDFEVPDTAADMPQQHETPLAIHPATLDLIYQAVWPLLGAGTQDGLQQLYLPSHFDKLSICWKKQPVAGDQLRIYCRQDPPESANSAIAHDMILTSASNDEDVLICLDNFKMAPVPKPAESSSAHIAEYGWNMKLEPILDFSTAKDFQIEISPDELAAERKRTSSMEEAAFYFISDTLKVLQDSEVTGFQPHHQRLVSWFHDIMGQSKRGDPGLQSEAWLGSTKEHREQVMSNVQGTGVMGKVISKIGTNLVRILKQEVDPVTILNEEGLWNQYHAEIDSFKRSHRHAAAVVSRMGAQNPTLNILQIGSGTGSATLPILEALGGGETSKAPMFSNYTITDTSDNSFGDIKESLGAWGDLVSYQTLDISADVEKQGHTLGPYDIVVCSKSLYATPSISNAVRNARQLLKPGGKLLLIEETSFSLRQLFHAVLPDWWQSEDESRSNGPILTEQQWQTVLKDSGLTGIDLLVPDLPGQDQSVSLMVSSVVVPDELSSTDVAIIHDGNVSDLVTSLSQAVEARTGLEPSTGKLEEISVKDKIAIVVTELDEPVLSKMTEAFYSRLQNLVATASGILWVVKNAYAASDSPESNMAVGFARSIRSEAALKFVTLDIDSLHDATRQILFVLSESFGSKSALNTGEMEYVSRGGSIMVPRIIPDVNVNMAMGKALGQRIAEPQPWFQEGRNLSMKIENPGALDTIFFDDLPLQDDLPADHVEIEVSHIGVNFRDIMQTMGQITGSGLGVECSGIITAVGSSIFSLSPGDRVCAVTWGAYANKVRCRASSVGKIPDSMTLENAASVPVVFCTAYHSLVDIGRLKKDETILIHGGAGGVGQAAILISQWIGAEAFVTVSSKYKKEFLKNTYGLDDDHIFFSRDTSFAEAVKAATSGVGVDVVLNSLSGDALRATWEVVAPFGRFVELGKRDIVQNSRLEMTHFERNLTFASVDLMGVAHQRPKIMKALMDEVFALFEQNKLKPVAPITSFGIDNLENAFRTLQSGKGMGKIVIEARKDALIKAMPRKVTTSLLKPDATYVIIGGTGGLGRSLTMWFADQGAKHLVLVSRSGSSASNVRQIVEGLEQKGVSVVVCKCDMTSTSDVETVLQPALKDVPPVAGAIYGAMVLKDELFESQSHADFTSIIKPKVDGVWNLHNALSSTSPPLDFFILISSMAGIVGNRGQSAYSATATFMDAFAQYRRARGQTAVALDLCPVKEVGYLAENLDRQKQVADVLGEGGIDELELRSIFDIIIRQSNAPGFTSQCITGMAIDQGSTKQFWLSDPKFSHLVRASLSSSSQSSEDLEHERLLSPGRAIKASTSTEDAENIATAALLYKISAVLMQPLEELDASKPLAKYGMDSLIAIEVRNWIARELEANLQILEILTADSASGLAKTILEKSKLVVSGKVESSG